jgi:cell pole-organizing protein PopZ
MGAMPNEPSMEEILSSIKRIIADEDRAVAPRRAAGAANARIAPRDADSHDQILELTEALPDGVTGLEGEDVQQTPAAKPAKATRAEPRAPARNRDTAARSETATAAVLSDMSAKAARDSLENLSKLLVRSDDGQSNTLEGLVREMLRPMLKDWLDANLPQLVETMVKREINRITGRV